METIDENNEIRTLITNGERKFLEVKPDTTLETIYSYPETHASLKQVLSRSISWHRRNETSMYVSLRSPNIDSLWLTTLFAIESEIVLEDGHYMLLADYLDTPGKREKPVSFQLPIQVPDRYFGTSYIGMTPADKSIIGTAATVIFKNNVIKNISVALNGTWGKKVKILKSAEKLTNQKLNKLAIQSLIDNIDNEIQPTGDFQASVEYRTEMARITTRRALEMCQNHEVQI